MNTSLLNPINFQPENSVISATTPTKNSLRNRTNFHLIKSSSSLSSDSIDNSCKKTEILFDSTKCICNPLEHYFADSLEKSHFISRTRGIDSNNNIKTEIVDSVRDSVLYGRNIDGDVIDVNSIAKLSHQKDKINSTTYDNSDFESIVRYRKGYQLKQTNESLSCCSHCTRKDVSNQLLN